jgi:hypothetical protein
MKKRIGAIGRVGIAESSAPEVLKSGHSSLPASKGYNCETFSFLDASIAAIQHGQTNVITVNRLN